jgi:hypothetical protein
LVCRYPGIEDLAGGGVDRFRVRSIAIVQLSDIPRIHALNVLELHSIDIVLHGIDCT